MTENTDTTSGSVSSGPAPSPGRAAAYPHCPCCRPGCRARHDEPCEHEPARPAEGAETGPMANTARAAYEIYRATVADVLLPPWDELTSAEQRAWEAAVQAAIDESDSTALAQLAMAQEAISDLAAERDEARAEAARLRGLLHEAHSETRSLLARMDALARELEALSAEHAPGAKSGTEAAVAKRLRAITCTDPAIDPPSEIERHAAKAVREAAAGLDG